MYQQVVHSAALPFLPAFIIIISLPKDETYSGYELLQYQRTLIQYIDF